MLVNTASRSEASSCQFLL